MSLLRRGLAAVIFVLLTAGPWALGDAPAGRARAGAPGDSGVAIAVKEMKVGYLTFRRPRPDGTFEEVASDKPVLLVTIQITNKGDKPVTYTTGNGIPGTKSPVAAIRDSKNQVHAVVQFDATLERDEGIKEAALKPGESVVDVLAFVPPPEGARPETLLLPAACHGNEGTWKIPLQEK